MDLKVTLLSSLVLILFSCGNSQSMYTEKERKKMDHFIVLQSEMTVKKGETIYYAGHVHGSVGESFDISFDNDDVIEKIGSDFEYDDPKKANMSGGDGGIKYVYYKANKEGKATMTIQDIFRGKVKETYTISITVEE